MERVKDIYEFFLEDKSGKGRCLVEFLDTVPGFKEEEKDGLGRLNLSMASEYGRICEKMREDNLLLKTNTSNLCLNNRYLAIHPVNAVNPKQFLWEMDYGVYDFKYRGFTYIYSHFKDSVLPIVGQNVSTGDEDLGTAYYVGDNLFVTAAHCIEGLKDFNLRLFDSTTIPIEEIWLPEKHSTDDYDLAIIKVNFMVSVHALQLDDPSVLDEVLVMGYPPIPGLNPTIIAETASVGSYINKQKTSVGQVVGEVGSYFSELDFFIINARVKGGNSGGPVINNEGKVIGTVFQLPFDLNGGSDGGRYDIMGFGVCLPSKYTLNLISNHYTKIPSHNAKGYNLI